jgi:hypothetical protein
MLPALEEVHGIAVTDGCASTRQAKAPRNKETGDKRYGDNQESH